MYESFEWTYKLAQQSCFWVISSKIEIKMKIFVMSENYLY